MSPTRTLRRYPFPALLVAFAASRGGAADVPAAAVTAPPAIGTVREVPAVSVSLEVGSMDKETKRVVYAPPPGWYVRSHRVVVAHRTGTSSFTVSTVPAGWNWMSDERVAASGKASAAAKVVLPTGLPAGGGEVAGSKDTAVSDRQANKSSHHVLVVDVTAKGAGLWQGGGGIDLTVYAEMVYLGR